MSKTLIRGGTVLSVDPQIGDLPRGDVLIEDDKIVAVQPEISADAEVIDATGMIVIPASSTPTGTRGRPRSATSAPNATLDDYFVEILDTFAPHYRAEDVYASNLAGSLECLNAASPRWWTGRTSTTPRPRGRGDPRPAGDGHPGAVRVRQRQHLAGRLLVREQAIADSRRLTCAGSATPTSPATTACITMALATRGPGFCQGEGWCAGNGSWPASWASRSPCTWPWVGWPGPVAWQQLPDMACSAAEHHYVQLLLLSDEEQWQRSPTLAAPSRSPPRSRRRWARVAAGGQGDAVRAAPSFSIDVVTHRAGATCSPRCARRSRPSGPA
jgi:hypothetical protein